MFMYRATIGVAVVYQLSTNSYSIILSFVKRGEGVRRGLGGGMGGGQGGR